MKIPATVLFSFLAASAVAAQVPPDAGAIVDEVESRISGYGDFTANLAMTLRSEDGSERTREMTISSLETPEGREKTLVVFERPRDLRGTAVLTVSHPDRESEQWLHLPALRRTRRIATGNRSDSFMGSEFTYEDIGSQNLRRYRYERVGRETLEGVETFVLERVPLSEDSGYARQRVWVDTEEYRIRRIDYHGPGDTLLKTLELDGYAEYADGQWRPARMVMTHHGTGRSTTLRWSDYEFRTGLTDADFDPRRLARNR